MVSGNPLYNRDIFNTIYYHRGVTDMAPVNFDGTSHALQIT